MAARKRRSGRWRSEERVLWRQTLVTGPVMVKPAGRRGDRHFACAPRALHMGRRAGGGVRQAERGRDPRRNGDAPPDVRTLSTGYPHNPLEALASSGVIRGRSWNTNPPGSAESSRDGGGVNMENGAARSFW